MDIKAFSEVTLFKVWHEKFTLTLVPQRSYLDLHRVSTFELFFFQWICQFLIVATIMYALDFMVDFNVGCIVKSLFPFKILHFNFKYYRTIIRNELLEGVYCQILFFKFIYFNWRLITLQYCSGFCHTLTWISHGCTCVPHPETPSHLPAYSIPLGHPSAPALSILSHASNLDWWSVSNMIIHMFQWYFLKSSHLRLLPQSPKDCSIHLYLFCCLTYRVIIAIFMNSIYMR